MAVPKWLDSASIYSLYPQSFNDSNGDGIGDLKGITDKLEYIKSLGFTAIWMNPIFESPFVDAGYDITDFYKVAPRYGTNEDVRALCDKAHSLGLKILLDLVAGHVALNHKGYQMSAKAEKNEWTDRFIWTNGTKGFENRTDPLFYKMTTRPEAERDGYNHFNYYREQPSINYGFAECTEDWMLPPSHPACRENVKELMRIMEYWFGYGVDGFRVDLAHSLVKNDNGFAATMKIWQEIRAWFDANYPDHVLLSEWGLPEKALLGGFHMDLMLHHRTPYLTRMFRNEYYARKFRAVDKLPGSYHSIDKIGPSYFRREPIAEEEYREGMECYVDQYTKTHGVGLMANITSSHDTRRLSVGRQVDDLKACYAHIALMPGVFVNYYGDEIGMRNVECPDVEGGRDRCLARTPMQWNDDKNHGFSTADNTYLPTDPAPHAPTVAAQLDDPDSLLNYVKALLRLKAEHPALANGSEFKMVHYGYPEVFERSCDTETIRVVIQPANVATEYRDEAAGEVLFAHRAELVDGVCKLAGISVLVYRVK